MILCSKAILKKVGEYADHCHANYKRRYTGEKYAVHPQRVMALCSNYHDDIEFLSAALLHDVLRNPKISANAVTGFLNGFMDHAKAQTITEMVVELTDVYTKEKFPRNSRSERAALERERMKQMRPLTQTIKYADMLDDCAELVVYDKDYAQVFVRDCLQVVKVLDKGHNDLRQRTTNALFSMKNELRPFLSSIPKTSP